MKTAGPAQVASSGPYRLKVTVPVGAGAGTGPPVTVATSDIGAPRAAPAVAWVAMVTLDWVTTDVSFGSPQAVAVLE